ncbi:MAG TPA: Gfo/Idh/MocA family oxidoreductase [Thermoanaerobaculia bacterium]|nr:Gfo/Idh/MocA family oxidoreductase [Thermoanaerobaculia bacterium]
MSKTTRRDLAKSALALGAALATRPLSALTPRPGAPAIGSAQGPASDRVRVAVMGIRSRGRGLARELARLENVEVATLCDVDERYYGECVKAVEGAGGATPARENDVRRVLEDPDLDALVIAAPDHWHAPASILAVAAGKHVYVEKPCGHTPREGELLIEAQRRTGKVIHMGNQRRSWPVVNRCIEALRGGVIGRVYFARTWYSNDRASIGFGMEATPPPELDWELWQGPAPRTRYRDNVHPYDWHWFERWGTGEALNNGTHELDVARWGLGVGYPTRVTASGGRYAFRDDWEFPDTMVLSCEFEGGATITWEGRSCNRHPVEGWERGVLFHGERGTVLQVGDTYRVYANDAAHISLEEVGADRRGEIDVTDPTSPDASLDGVHLQSFVGAVRGTAPSTIPIEEAHKSVLLGHLGNIAWRVGRALDIDPTSGRIQNDPEAEARWSREYEPGWEPRI